MAGCVISTPGVKTSNQGPGRVSLLHVTLARSLTLL